MNRQYSISGFSLYEILFAVAITALLAAIALPAYQRYVKDARLKQAASALQDNAHALERFYAQYKSFKKNSTTWADLAVKQNDYFCFRMQGNARGALSDNFTVKAVALNKDSEPRVLKINQDMILTLCETSTSSCSESNTYFSNANGTDSNCVIYE